MRLAIAAALTVASAAAAAAEDHMTPGPVVGDAPLRAGETMDVAAILTEEVAPGDRLMPMVQSEEGGIFEYTLGAGQDGPIRVDDDLVMTTIIAE